MKTLFNALKGINKFGLALVALTAITLMSFTAAKQATVNKKYSYDPSQPAGSQWTDVSHLQQSDENELRDYRCDFSSEICTAEFDENINPNTTPATPMNIVPGDFVLEDN